MPAAGPGSPPEPPPAGAAAAGAPPAAAVVRLKRRAEFKAASGGARWHAAPFTLQAVARRGAGDPAPTVGVGFTTTKRLGGAVVRNRIRRRLREAARAALPDSGARPGTDYVLLARPAALTCAFSDLVNELRRGLPAVTRKLDRGGPPRAPRS